MRVKKILIVLIMIILTGCTADYNLTLKADSTIKEELIVKVKDTNDTYEGVVNLLENNVSKNNYKISRDSENIVVIYNKEYDDIETYILDSVIYKQIFDDIQINKTVDKTTLETAANFNNRNLSINKDNEINFDEMKINILSELPVRGENADKKEENKYTWIYNGNQKMEDISITYLNTPSIMTQKSIIVIILIIVCSSSIGFIIYRRFKQRQVL